MTRIFQTIGDTGLAMADLIHMREARAEAVSADGTLIASLENTSGFPQVWMRTAAGGAAWRVTDLPERVVQIAFSPVGRDLLLTTDCGGDERHQFYLLSDASGPARPLTAAPGVVHLWGAWSPCGTKIAYAANARDPRCMDIHEMTVATGQVRTLLEGRGFQEALAWTPDRTGLLLRDSINGSTRQTLALLNIAAGTTRTLAPETGRTRYLSARMAKDGRGVYLICDRDREFHALQWLDFATDRITPLIAVEGCDIDLWAPHPDGKRAVVAVNEEGASRLFIAPLAGDGGQEDIPLPLHGVVQSLKVLADGHLLMTLEGANDPADLWRHDPDTGDWCNLSQAPKAGMRLAGRPLPLVARLPGMDGADVPHFVYPPQGERPAKGWPVLFIVHGGPEAQWRPTFRAEIHHYTSHGIMVVAPNVRGSTGYGRPWHEADDVEKRMDSVGDLIALARAFAARADVDAARIGVMGQSYGGFMVLAAMTAAPDLWRTGIDIYGVANFTTLLETTGPWRAALRAAEYGDPVRDAAFLAEVSPVRHLDRLAAPLLVIHATDDPRVPIEQGEQVFARLRGRGHPVEMLRIEHEGHGFVRLQNRLTVFGRIADWLAQFL
ncbi:prolyl oligopeptidase family serine peptidase [Falsirhodobacter algicola]|uniref:Prolyl oligopeptidase family serine peptidase n=1 Tax=Falsirhodobacter algicola TaxID=2692330 RepID=A0A8J8MTJ0_9RHOB|nr:prolyl oligopeptidase family serine peptidase [Falsirhodobacter algicola]QUS36141.1 prolyl oligopeptidase family serine peptidase [Falsirhodobacter algicola]